MADFEVLLQLTDPSICLMDTKYRTAVPPAIRLAAAWRYLASEDTFTGLMYSFKI
jgi:hypothetical protein